MARFAIYDQFVSEATGEKYTAAQAAKEARAMAKDKGALARRNINDIYNEYSNKINKAPVAVQKSMRLILDKYKAVADAALDKSVSDSAVATASDRFRKQVESKIGKKLEALEAKDAE